MTLWLVILALCLLALCAGAAVGKLLQRIGKHYPAPFNEPRSLTEDNDWCDY